MRRGVVAAVVLSVIASTLGAWSPTEGGIGRHASGVEIVGQSRVAALPTLALRRAWSDALLLSENSSGLGYPWADTSGDTLVVTTINSGGDAAARAWIAAGAQHPNAKIGMLPRPLVPVRLRTATLNFAALESIKLDATRLVQAGLPDADAIYETEPDWENNRVIITLSRNSDALISAIADRYGPNTVAVRIAPRPATMPHTRSSDSSPFYGGAQITATLGCSSGFSWTDSTNQYMLTAAHCAASGATTVTTPADSNMGAITSGSRENWTNNTGTILFPGDSTYRGDVALIQLSSGRSAGAFMYSGAYPDQASASTVHEMWWTVPAYGEQYCTGGSNTYALCGWGVHSARINHLYGNGEWALNVTKGLKNSGSSTNGGDSGGPVYTVNGSGTIAAKGIHSGGTVGTSCSVFVTCIEIFTDILLPYYYFPGWLKTL